MMPATTRMIYGRSLRDSEQVVTDLTGALEASGPPGDGRSNLVLTTERIFARDAEVGEEAQTILVELSDLGRVRHCRPFAIGPAILVSIVAVVFAGFVDQPAANGPGPGKWVLWVGMGLAVGVALLARRRLICLHRHEEEEGPEPVLMRLFLVVVFFFVSWKFAMIWWGLRRRGRGVRQGLIFPVPGDTSGEAVDAFCSAVRKSIDAQSPKGERVNPGNGAAERMNRTPRRIWSD
jgi:hypothetical protein